MFSQMKEYEDDKPLSHEERATLVARFHKDFGELATIIMRYEATVYALEKSLLELAEYYEAASDPKVVGTSRHGKDCDCDVNQGGNDV